MNILLDLIDNVFFSTKLLSSHFLFFFGPVHHIFRATVVYKGLTRYPVLLRKILRR